ncbi:MAG TPA: GMC family oxidoreductase [Gemmatimonadales bacterium]|nr:GMC family oxidoreductase [Gemmatimonadales bacterium]
MTFDAIVVGSGFGGAMAARVLVHAGWRVLLLERGGWVARGPENWAQENVGELTRHYSQEAPYRQLRGGRDLGAYHCVGGPSVFYGGVSLRFRERDFEVDRDIIGDSGARWPLGYADLEPYYTAAERILGVSGAAGEDPTEPRRSEPFPHPAADLAPVTQRIERAARGLGLQPFRLPLAINRVAAEGRGVCQACGTCDGFACAVGAKNDLATTVIGPLLGQGLRLEVDSVVTRLLTDGKRVTGVEVASRESGERTVHRGREVILAAGALATPHLLLTSDLASLNPGGRVIGRYLQRHYNEILFGIFPTPPNPGGGFHKQIGIHDLYFGHSSIRAPSGKLGGMQQLPTPPVGLVRAELPSLVGAMCAPWIKHLTGLLVMAEDQPVYENSVLLDETASDRYGVPRLLIDHRHTSRDKAAGSALAGVAKRILRRAGALAIYRHQVATFSHAVGTVRMGPDRFTSALDADCRFRGLENLTVVDASALPTSAAVNPSLTISAIALRAAERLAARASVMTASTMHVSAHR